jgi:hypothetical protein
METYLREKDMEKLLEEQELEELLARQVYIHICNIKLI